METIHHVKESTKFKREHKADYGKEKIEILYEDKDIIVILKPSGMLSVAYPGSKARTAQEVLEKIMRQKGMLNRDHKPLVVHRLDRDTSGVMMFALNEATQKKVMDTWHKMVTSRIYRAVAENPTDKSKFLPKEGIIDDKLAQNAHHVGYVPNKKNDNAKTVAARTHYKILEQGPTHTLFELELDTGKKNQIRAHLSNKGYPLAGDENYRAKTDPFGRLALHACTLEFIHPSTGKMMKFSIPEDSSWLEYVKKGDKNPKIPIWISSKPHSKPSSTKENNFTIQKVSGKSLRKMNFIERGKFKK